ncbi:hypothetical protein PAXINDRAFT_14197 [Paxillus involutus ATCC 200175]|uniref:Unplaced genomic scaffold PAXINscaffold_35, whole genome shotgun sequence n=1 Tax=Paxillus involutus ATCC 200175 TaxID=664439 RepID=A0A0C9TZI7_PAXIN|nr:hypothetical protein PAXINDRAFT_14197 [Paxillus involutus ATCC 200175]
MSYFTFYIPFGFITLTVTIPVGAKTVIGITVGIFVLSLFMEIARSIQSRPQSRTHTMTTYSRGVPLSTPPPSIPTTPLPLRPLSMNMLATSDNPYPSMLDTASEGTTRPQPIQVAAQTSPRLSDPIPPQPDLQETIPQSDPHPPGCRSRNEWKRHSMESPPAYESTQQ